MVIILTFTYVRAQPAGSIDASFNASHVSAVRALALQPDGKLLVATAQQVMRLLDNGDVDPGFAIQTAASGEVHTIAPLPTGEMLVGGSFRYLGAHAKRGVARLGADGTIDSSFSIPWYTNDVPSVHRIGVQRGGRLIVTGARWSNGTLLRQYRLDGSLLREILGQSPSGGGGCTECYTIGSLVVLSDDTFLVNDGQGFAQRYSSFGEFINLTGIGFREPYEFTELPGRSVLVGGAYSISNGIGVGGLVRLRPDGTVDSSFAPDRATNGRVAAIAIQPDDKILIAGSFTNIAGHARSGIARLLSNGALDLTFNPGSGFAGLAITSLGLQSDGRILVGGAFTNFAGASVTNLVRLHNDLSSFPAIAVAPTNTTIAEGLDAFLHVGTPCSSCTVQWQHTGTNVLLATNRTLVLPRATRQVAGEYAAILRHSGLAVTSAPVTLTITSNTHAGLPDLSFNIGGGPDARAYAMALTTDGGILLGGDFETYDGLPFGKLVRLHADGTLDRSFDPKITPTGVGALAVAPDGGIYITGGFTNINGVPRQGMARLHQDGRLDESFDIGSSNYFPHAVAVQSNGKLLIALYAGPYRRDLRRLNLDGTPDTTFHYGQNTPLAGDIYVIQEQNDGTLLVGGGGGVELLHADGSRDPNFQVGPAGWLVQSMARSPQGELIVGGRYGAGSGVVAQYPGSGGLLNLSVESGSSPNVAVDGCGRVFVTGRLTDGTNRFAFAKVRATQPRLDTSFPVGKADGDIHSLIRLPDESFLLAGSFTRINGVSSPGIARLRTPIPPPSMIRISTNSATLAGRSITLSVSFADCPRPALQWFRNGVPLTNATWNSLTIVDPRLGDAGAYTVVAANGGGSITSNPVAVTIERSSISPGRLDVDFGYVETPLTDARALAIQPDEKVLIGGTSSGSARVVRLHRNGSLDSAFTATNAFSCYCTLPAIQCLSLESDGSIFAGGWFEDLNSIDWPSGIARLSPSGSVDSAQPSWWNASLGGASFIHRDRRGGKLVVAANGYSMWRIAEDGARDLNFSVAASGGEILTLAEQADGRLLIGGNFTFIAGTPRTRIARLSDDGAIDSTLGAAPNGPVRAIVLQNDRIVLGGDFTVWSGQPRLRVVAMLSSGSLDPSFSTNASPNSNVVAMVVQPDGKIIIAGHFTMVAGVPRTGLARLLADGNLDLEFDPGTGANDVVRQLMLDENGRLFIAGKFSRYEDVPRAGLARVHTGVTIGATATTEGVKLDTLTASGWEYILERSASLVNPVWTPVVSRMGDGATHSFTNSTTEPAGFYRLRVK